jgi:Fe-S-cluster containining protein
MLSLAVINNENNEDKETCTKCGGECCKRYPGIIAPDDLGATTRDILSKCRELLRTGGYQVDWWEGDPNIYFVRPKIMDHRSGSVFSPSWGGSCYFLAYNGCTLLFEDRPLGCRVLVPNKETPGRGCVNPKEFATKWEFAVLWKPYSKQLKLIGREVEEEIDKPRRYR